MLRSVRRAGVGARASLCPSGAVNFSTANHGLGRVAACARGSMRRSAGARTLACLRTRLGEAAFEIRADGWPLLGEDGEVDGVAFVAVGGDHVVAEGAFAGGAEFGDGVLGVGVAGVAFELDADGAQCVEGVGEHEELGLGIDARAAVGGGDPRCADLQAAVFGADLHEGGGADGEVVCWAGLEVDHREGDAVWDGDESGDEVAEGGAGPGFGCVEVVLEGVGCGGVEEGIGVVWVEGFEAQVGAGECGGAEPVRGGGHV